MCFQKSWLIWLILIPKVPFRYPEYSQKISAHLVHPAPSYRCFNKINCSCEWDQSRKYERSIKTLTFQTAIARSWMHQMSWNFLWVLRVPIGYFGIKMSQIDQLFWKHIFCPKVVKSVFSKSARYFLIWCPPYVTHRSPLQPHVDRFPWRRHWFLEAPWPTVSIG